MADLDRRHFVETSLLTAASVGLGLNAVGCSSSPGGQGDGIILDTNVNLRCFPFRDLKFGATEDLVGKLRRHKIKEAWAGSYEALFHKNIDGVNARLAEECETKGDGLLVPFGTVNPAWPDWEEDLRRVDEVYGMSGVKIFPGYQNFSLSDPAFEAFFEQAANRGLVVQIVTRVEDRRVRHPRVEISYPDVAPLVDLYEQVPNARAVLTNTTGHVRGDALQTLVDETNVMFGIAWLEGTGGIGRVIEGNHWWLGAQVPAERLVFDTHAPFFPVENGLLRLVESPLSESDAEAIMHANAEHLMQAT